MSEKTTVTVDCGLTIPEGTEKVYEGQHLRLVAGIDIMSDSAYQKTQI